jgi:hypothetical protein
MKWLVFEVQESTVAIEQFTCPRDEAVAADGGGWLARRQRVLALRLR